MQLHFSVREVDIYPPRFGRASFALGHHWLPSGSKAQHNAYSCNPFEAGAINKQSTTQQNLRNKHQAPFKTMHMSRKIPEFGIASHSVNPLSEVGAGLQGSFHLGGVHGLVLGQVLRHSMGDKTQKQEKWCPCTGKTRKRKRKSQANEQVRHYEATNCSFFCDSFLSVVKRHCALRPRLFLRSTVTLIISDHL